MDNTRALRLLSPNRLGGALLVGLLSMTPASAAIIIHNFNVPLTSLPVTDTLSLPGFNPALGTLTGIRIDLSVRLVSDYGFENLSGAAATISGSIVSNATLRLPDNSPLSTVAATITRTETVGAFDGVVIFNPTVINYDGASGRSYLDEEATNSNSVTLTDGASLAFFSSNGTFLLPFEISATSAFGGAAILAQSLNSGAGTATITYEYEPTRVLGEVPEPGTLLSMGLGGVLVGLLRVRRAA